MKVTDIMVDDWVLKDMNYEEENPMYTHPDYRPYKIQNGEDIDIACETNCIGDADIYMPIPLTPEILEKNGFHFGYTSNEEDMAACTIAQLNPNDKGWVWDEGDGAIKVIFPNESDGGEVKLEGTNYLACVFDKIYVHQLQHLLRLCDINKEIDLR